jgi:hypothetical protein
VKKARRPPRRLGWTLLCLCLLALTALPGSIPQSRAASTNPTDPAISPPQRQDPPQRMDLAAAWGAPIIQRLPTQIDTGHRFVFGDAVTADGTWLIGSIEPRLIFAATNETPIIALYNIESRAFLRLHATRTPRSQLLGAASDGDWVIWSEATDALRNADWTMYAYNMSTKQTTQLAQAERVNGAVAAGTMPRPVMDHGLVVWAQATTSATGAPASVVRMRDIASGTVTTLGAGMDPRVSWPWVAWRDESGRDKVRTNEPVASDVMRLLNVQTQEVLSISGSAQSLALSGVSLAICRARSLELVDDVAQHLHTPATILSVESPNHLQDVTISDRLIGWTEVGPAEVWDRLLRVFVELPIRNGQSATWTHGNTLVWLDPQSPEEQRQDVENNLYPTPDINVIAVTTLPTKLATQRPRS